FRCNRGHASWAPVEAPADRRGDDGEDRVADGRRRAGAGHSFRPGGCLMRIELVKRPQQSTLFSILSPVIALVLTMIAGGLLFAALGKNPVDALYFYFLDPLRETWSLHELAVKAAPLILIGVGLSICFA